MHNSLHFPYIHSVFEMSNVREMSHGIEQTMKFPEINLIPERYVWHDATSLIPIEVWLLCKSSRIIMSSMKKSESMEENTDPAFMNPEIRKLNYVSIFIVWK